MAVNFSQESRWCKFLALVLVQLAFCSSQEVPNYIFLHEATSAPPTLNYDYIIIGGGTAGCPLAATLSQAANVLVLERGGSPYGNPNITNMDNFAAPFRDNSPTSPSQQFISEDGVYNNRARVLGGGSCLNAGFYSRASKQYWKSVGWDEKLVVQSYEWVERVVAFEPPVMQWQSAVKDGLLEVGVGPDNGFTYDHEYGTKVGGTIFDKKGQRHTAADLLGYANPRRIAVYLHATVHKILFDTKGQSKPKAIGVIFQDEKGAQHTAFLTKIPKSEIIVSSGALGSPQLLMLSGIGPKSHLQKHGINITMDQPMVGQGMADNPMNALYIPSPMPVERSLIQVVGITRSGSFIEAASANFAFAWLGSYIFGSNNNQTSQFNIQLPSPLLSAIQKGGVILEKIPGPKSSGHLELISTNASDNPSVTFNYFSDPEDLRMCVEGMKTIIDVIKSQSFLEFRYPFTHVEALISLAASVPINRRDRHVHTALSIEQFCIDTVVTIWHYHGGCHVGKVVDNDYKVLGVDALRVVDGSTFLNSPGTNPQATVMMLGRYMGQKILQERTSP